MSRRRVRDFLRLAIAGVVQQFRPPQRSDFGGGGLDSPIYIDARTGESFIYVNGAIRSLTNTGTIVDVSGYILPSDPDATLGINRAIAYVNSLTTPTILRFSPGSYAASASLTSIKRSNVVIEGYGAVLTVTGAVSAITFSGGAYNGLGNGPCLKCKVLGLQIVSSTSNGTLGIRLEDTQFTEISGVTVQKFVSAVSIAAYEYPVIIGCDFDECKFGVSAYFGDGLTIDDTRMNGTYSAIVAGSCGVQLQGQNGGTLIANTDVTRFEHGLDMQPAGTDGVSFVYMDGFEADTCTFGLYAKPNTNGRDWFIHAVNSWFSTSTVNGVYLEKVNVASFVNCFVFNNGDQGFVAINCKDIRVANSLVGWNNTSNAANTGGIYAESCVGVFIQNNTITNQLGIGAVPTALQNTGVTIAVTCNDLHITGNSFANHATNDILQTGATPATDRCVIRGNTTDASNSVASASNITPALVHDVLHVTGVTNVDNILTSQMPTKTFTLITDGACTIKDTFNFALAGDFVGTPGSQLVVMANRVTSKWTEVSRAIV